MTALARPLGDGKYLSGQQQRVVALIRTLAGNEIEGLAPSQVAKALGCAPSQVTRDMANLRHAGWAEQIPATGRWRLGPEIVQIAVKHAAAIGHAERRLDEVRNRYSRG